MQEGVGDECTLGVKYIGDTECVMSAPFYDIA